MRYAADHKEKTREALLAAAARALKSGGAAGLSIGQVMSAAGLTHGGFYAHFPSRDALIAAALERTLDEMRGLFAARVAGKPRARALADYIDFYVSATHRDGAARGCILTALGSEAGRLEAPAREAFSRGHAMLAMGLATLIAPDVTSDPQALALSMVAEMVGAVTLARATTDPDLSDRLLAASRAALKARAGLPKETLQ